MSTITSVAEAFFEACETGGGWAACERYCAPDAGFSAQADALADRGPEGVPLRIGQAREAGIDEGRRFRGHGRRLFDGDPTLNVHRRHSAGSDSRIAKLS